MSEFLHFLKNGGIFMLPLVICSLVSVAFILERWLVLRRNAVLPVALRNELIQLKRVTPEFEHSVQAHPSPLGRLLQACLEHRNWSRDENVETIQTAARTEMVQLERGLLVLEIIAGVAPLLGLLGTLSGLIKIFASVSKTGIADQGILLAKGISEALNATVGGLVVAIPALIFYSYYSKKVEALGVEMERLCLHLVKKMYGPNGVHLGA